MVDLDPRPLVRVSLLEAVNEATMTGNPVAWPNRIHIVKWNFQSPTPGGMYIVYDTTKSEASASGLHDYHAAMAITKKLNEEYWAAQ
jgi:hypothetical protein